MNNIFTPHNTTAVLEPARRIRPAGTDSAGSGSAYQAHINALSNSDIAQKVMRLTGSIRLARRSGQSWHHCGLNE